MTTFAPDFEDITVGTRRRLDGYDGRLSSWQRPAAKVVVTVENDEHGPMEFEFCAVGARVMAKALIEAARVVDPPKPRRRRTA